MNETIENFTDYEQRQLKVAERILGYGGALAEDACQKARLAVHKRILSNKKPIRDLWPYFRAATVHACYEILRAQYRIQSLFEGALERYSIAEAHDPVRAVMQADLLLTSDRIVRKELGMPYVDIFRLRFLDGLAFSAIAVRLNMPLSTAKNYHKKILETLRRTLNLT